jgi:hypothetical protein
MLAGTPKLWFLDQLQAIMLSPQKNPAAQWTDRHSRQHTLFIPCQRFRIEPQCSFLPPESGWIRLGKSGIRDMAKQPALWPAATGAESHRDCVPLDLSTPVANQSSENWAYEKCLCSNHMSLGSWIQWHLFCVLEDSILFLSLVKKGIGEVLDSPRG